MAPKKILKICAGVIIFFTLPSLLFFSFLYLKYNEDIPQNTPGPAADVLAENMLTALNYDAYNKTSYIEWTFNNRHHYKWHKSENRCEVYWKNIQVNLNLNNKASSAVYINQKKTETENNAKLINQAFDYFNNDSFWLAGPYKVFDHGTKRAVVNLENGKKGLLVTYTSGGSTPGDSYLWLLNKDHKPYAFKMWVSILPIDGLEASWSDWTITETGAQLPTFHKLMFLGLNITNLKTSF